MQLGVVGQLSLDVIAGEPPRIGGPPWHASRALRALGVEARLVAKCGEAEVIAFTRQLETLDMPFDLVVGERTTAFSFTYDAGGVRAMTVDVVGDAWRADELSVDGIDWVYVAPLLRDELDLAHIGDGRTVLLDAHGLVRVREPGPLRLSGDSDRTALAHVAMLKAADEEAAVIGDVDVPEMIVTHGARGATVNGVHVYSDAVDRDPTGAGDMFGAAYLVSRAEGADLVEAARRAAALVSELLR